VEWLKVQTPSPEFKPQNCKKKKKSKNSPIIHMEHQKTQNKQSNPDKAGGTIIPDFKLIHLHMAN
jgi:hypothetical protein